MDHYRTGPFSDDDPAAVRVLGSDGERGKWLSLPRLVDSCYPKWAMASPERLQIPDAEFARSAMILARRFVQRWDLYAVQLDDGRYVCVREPLNAAHLYAHLRGELTLGSYVLNPKSSARYIVFDADDRRQFADLVDLTRTLGNSLPSYLETSRRGGHLWLFFDHPIPGRDARAFGKGLLDRYRINDLELFPNKIVWAKDRVPSSGCHSASTD